MLTPVFNSGDDRHASSRLFGLHKGHYNEIKKGWNSGPASQGIQIFNRIAVKPVTTVTKKHQYSVPSSPFENRGHYFKTGFSWSTRKSVFRKTKTYFWKRNAQSFSILDPPGHHHDSPDILTPFWAASSSFIRSKLAFSARMRYEILLLTPLLLRRLRWARDACGPNSRQIVVKSNLRTLGWMDECEGSSGAWF